MIEFKTNVLDVPAGVPIIATNSVKFSIGDAITVVSGFLALVTSSSKVLGYCLEDITVTADNQTVAKYCPLYIYAEGIEVLVDTDQASVQTDVGLYADLATVTSGAQVLNLAGGSSGQFIVLGWDTDTANTSKAIVSVAEPLKLAFAQA